MSGRDLAGSLLGHISRFLSSSFAAIKRFPWITSKALETNGTISTFEASDFLNSLSSRQRENAPHPTSAEIKISAALHLPVKADDGPAAGLN